MFESLECYFKVLVFTIYKHKVKKSILISTNSKKEGLVGKLLILFINCATLMFNNGHVVATTDLHY